MNTGIKLETERLVLVPGSNARDNEHFLHMLRNDGNFTSRSRRGERDIVRRLVKR